MTASPNQKPDPVQAIADWLGQPEWWWIEPTPLFDQSRVAVWGQGHLPTNVRIDEFWAWGQGNGRSRAIHGVRRGNAWRFQKPEGDSGPAAEKSTKALRLAKSDKRYRAAAMSDSFVRFQVDEATGSVLMVTGDKA